MFRPNDHMVKASYLGLVLDDAEFVRSLARAIFDPCMGTVPNENRV
jgi:hypothetical protein